MKIGRTTAIAVIYTGGQIINEAIDMHIQARNSQPPFPQRPNVPQAQSTHVPAPMVYVYEETTWEYRVIVKNAAGRELLGEQELNELGMKGWELTGVATLADKVQFYFKRPRK